MAARLRRDRVGDRHVDRSPRPTAAWSSAASSPARCAPVSAAAARRSCRARAQSDGFVARVARDGAVEWLHRVGGAGADAVQGVALRGDRVAIAGTFASGAELGRRAVAAVRRRVPFADAFAAELDARPARASGRRRSAARPTTASPASRSRRAAAVAVAANLRGTMRQRSTNSRSGPSDGLVVWLSLDGELGATRCSAAPTSTACARSPRSAIARSSAASSRARSSSARRRSRGRRRRRVPRARRRVRRSMRAWQVGGAGREERSRASRRARRLRRRRRAHRGPAVDGEHLPAPKDPQSGAALVVRPCITTA